MSQTHFFVIALLVALVTAHSWIDCTDYTEKNGNYYAANKCRARPRNWQQHTGGGTFGADTGYNHMGGTTCKYALSAGGDVNSFYTSSYPMAQYSLGQEVCLAWPSKNHVAATCTNAFIPDNLNKIFISPINPTAEPTTWTEFANFGTNTPGKMLGETGGGRGFQNCPKFCENMDKSLCTGCFTIPSNFPTGRYVFQWRWVFNSGETAYTSCWDATIVSSGTAPTPTQPTNPSSNPDPAPTQPLVGNAIRLVNPPTKMLANLTSYRVNVEYSALNKSDIIVDVLQLPEYSWFGKAISKNVNAGSGSMSMVISFSKTPVLGRTYVLKPWIVAAGLGEADGGWNYELDRKEYPVLITNELSISGASSGTTIGLVACVTILSMLFALLAL